MRAPFLETCLVESELQQPKEFRSIVISRQHSAIVYRHWGIRSEKRPNDGSLSKAKHGRKLGWACHAGSLQFTDLDRKPKDPESLGHRKMKGYDKRSSPEPLVEQIDKLQDRILILSKEIGQGLAHLNVDFRGDQWIKRSYQHLLALLHDLTIALNGNDWLLSGDRLAHPMTFEEMSLYPSEFASAVSFDAASWRASLREGAAKALTAEDLKDVFDIYFRYDLYGRFRRPDTIFLNRGISDPWYFAPPAGVSLALDVANERNWFGYSDPLGHIATRESVAALERHRRRQPGITFENIAITQGATHTLTSLLNLLAWRGLRGKIVVPVPNYPPLVDQISHHFGIERLALSKDYGCEPAEIRHRVLRPDVVAVLLAYPHNPTTNGSLYQEVVELARLCSETNRYLIIIENAFSDLVSGNLDPIRFPNTIIISSWSKTYGTAGLSVGHIVADRKMIDLFYRYASSAYGSPPSFLYLTCTTLAMLELGHRLGTTNRFERELDETLSSPLLLFREFGHWCEAQGLRSEFSDMILKLVMNIRCFDSLKSVQSDPIVSSVNRVLQTRLEGSNYSTFLSVLAGKNVSVLPVDCLTPPDDRHDLRVTIALAPSELIHGVTATCEELDNLYAGSRNAMNQF